MGKKSRHCLKAKPTWQAHGLLHFVRNDGFSPHPLPLSTCGRREGLTGRKQNDYILQKSEYLGELLDV